MVCEVLFEDKKVGEIVWETDAYGVRITLNCAIPCDPLILLRCYGETPNGAFLIGLPEPRHGRLTLTRRIYRESLKEAGCLDNPPALFYLSDGASPPPRRISEPDSDVTCETEPLHSENPSQPEHIESTTEPVPSNAVPQPCPDDGGRVRTGDSLIDKLLDEGKIQSNIKDGEIELRCAFTPSEPFALAPIFALCIVENDEAVLRWKPKDLPLV